MAAQVVTHPMSSQLGYWSELLAFSFAGVSGELVAYAVDRAYR